MSGLMEQGSVGSLPDCANTTLSTVQSTPPEGDRTDEPASSGSQPRRPRRHQGVRYQERRFQWTFEMNCDLYSMYQKARSEGRGYMNRLLQYWTERYPNFSFSRQHLRDQASRLAKNSAFCAQYSVCVETTVPEMNQAVDSSDDPASSIEANTEGVEDFSQAATVDTLQDLSVTLPSNSAHEQEHQQFIDPLAIRFYELLPRILSTTLTLRRTLPRPNCIIQSESLQLLNDCISDYLRDISDLWTINCCVYTAAFVLLESRGRLKPAQSDDNKTSQKDEVSMVRSDLARVSNELFRMRVNLRNRTKKEEQIKNYLQNKYRVSVWSARTLTGLHESLIQMLKVATVRSNYSKTKESARKLNSQFVRDQRSVYRDFKKSHAPRSVPDANATEQFWKLLYSEGQFDSNCLSLKILREFASDCNFNSDPVHWEKFTSIEIESIMKKLPSWRAPGPDKIHTFWYKKFHSTYSVIATAFENLKVIEENEKWLCTGRTILLYKRGNSLDPGNYRPITCLNNLYKVLTSCLLKRFNKHVEKYGLYDPQQRGVRRNQRGCHENLLIDRMIMDEVHLYKRNLSCCWIDYRKAFDSISHGYMLEVVSILRFAEPFQLLLASLVQNWCTNLELGFGVNQTCIPIAIRKGIYQGDSLSPALFCLCLFPISLALKRFQGYSPGKPRFRDSQCAITHLYYIDDLKMYSSSRKELERMLTVLSDVSGEVGLQFCAEKSNICVIERGKIVNSSDGPGVNGIEHIDPDRPYKYLGILQTSGPHTAAVIEKVSDECLRRANIVWSSDLSAFHKVKAHNTWAVPVVSYVMPILKIPVTTIRNLDTKVRSVLTECNAHHLRSSVSRLYLPRSKGGRGLLSFEHLNERLLVDLCCYLTLSNGAYIQCVTTHEFERSASNIFRWASEIVEAYCHSIVFSPHHNTIEFDGVSYGISQLQKLLKLIKQCLSSQQHLLLERDYQSHVFHGAFLKKASGTFDMGLSFLWLHDRSITCANESLILAFQDGVVATRWMQKHIFDLDVCDSCRICGHSVESVEHVLSSCTPLAPTMYLRRHNQVLKILYHYFIGSPTKDYWRDPAPVYENDSFKLYWDQPVQVVGFTQSNRPDIVLWSKNEKCTYLIDVSIPSDSNLHLKFCEKIAKYSDLAMLMKLTYSLERVVIIPVIISITGLMSLESKSSLQNIVKDADIMKIISKLQKTALLGSCRIMRSVLLRD